MRGTWFESAGPGSGERVELGFDHTLRFDVEKLAGRWRVAAFRVN
jgi:hypothetical protein